MTSRQLQPPQQRCSAQRQPAALLCRLFSQRHTSAAHRQLQQHRRSHRSLEAVPARFANGSHLAYYEAPVAGSKKEKVASRIKAQRQRLKELQRETADQDGQVSHAQWSHLVQELREMSSNLSDVAKMAASSSSSSEGEDTGSGAAAAQRKRRALPQLPALARLAQAAPGESSFVQSASAPAALQGSLTSSPAASPALVLRDEFAARAAVSTDRAAGGLAVSPAAVESELAAVLRLRDQADAAPSAGAALLSAATSLAAGRDAHPECSLGQQRSIAAAAPASNIVAAPQAAAARVQVCQGKSCTKRGAADLLLQASAAGGGRPGVEVSGCKCLGECKRGPAVRVRTGRERPTVLTQVAADGGAELAGLMEREMLRAEGIAREQPQDAVVAEHLDAQKQLLGC